MTDPIDDRLLKFIYAVTSIGQDESQDMLWAFTVVDGCSRDEARAAADKLEAEDKIGALQATDDSTVEQEIARGLYDATQEGHLKVVKIVDGEPCYSLTDTGSERAESVIAGAFGITVSALRRCPKTVQKRIAALVIASQGGHNG